MGYLPTGRRCLLVTAVRGDRREPVPPARTIPFILVVALGAGDNRMKPGWPKPLPSSWTCSRLLRPASLRCARGLYAVSYTHLRAHETRHDLVCRLLLEKKKTK